MRVLADYDSAAVLAAIKTALQTQFGFAARSYGQSLSGSEVVAAMQNVTGVQRIDLNSLRQAAPAWPGRMAVCAPAAHIVKAMRSSPRNCC